jgi:hypothetical protein
MTFHRSIVCTAQAVSVALLLASFCAAQAGSVPRQPKPPTASEPPIPRSAVSVSPGNWSQLAKFIPVNGCCNGLISNPAAISGDTVVVGQEALGDGSKVVAQVFARTAKGWQNSPPYRAA